MTQRLGYCSDGWKLWPVNYKSPEHMHRTVSKALHVGISQEQAGFSRTA